MSVPVDVSVQLDDSSARARLTELDRVLRKIAEKKYTAKVDAAGAEIAAKNIAYLTSSAAKFDAQIKASEAAAKRFAAALQSQMQAEQDAEAAHQGMASSMNGVDQMIQRNEASARAFSAALQSQMQAEQAVQAANQGMASSMNVIDQAIQAAESAGKSFSAQLRMQMQAAQDDAKAQKALEVEQRKAEKAARDQAKAQQESATATEESATAATTAGSAFNALSVALGNIAARAFHMVVSKITQGIREAVTTMKDVDTQLTNISKVSGITGKALSDMGERAYETASKYGVAADEYLSAVYTFQKAGLGESAEAMGELAVKTMLVGDTTADVASQFLISANAAWKFGGDIERLNMLVDEADYINNNYATDLGKLSQGLPRVASVAAQSGMSAEETLAALGTITAVTQESGTKAATALRALILNIEGEIGSYVDDTGESFEVTEESVKSMQGLMEKYASAELEAARASGELINPMTAIKAIFEGMSNSDLNDQELFTLLSGMGGKLRTNQLTALVQNYELFDEMLGRIADSAGTADSEIALMMESWERKTQKLKNKWTEFIADFVDTDTIKGSIDVLTEAISGLDDLLFKTGSERTKSKYTDLKAEYDSLLSKGAALTAQEETRLKWIEKQTDALRDQAAAQANLEARNSGRRQVGTNPDGTPLYYEDAMYESLSAGWQNAGRQLSEGSISAEEYLSRMRDVVSANRDYYDSLMQWKDAGADLSDSQNNFIRDFEYAENVIKATSVDLQDAGDGYQYIVDQQGNAIAKIKAYDEAQNQATTATEDLADLWGNMAPSIKDVVEEHNQWSDSLDEESLKTHTAFDDLVSGTESAIQGLTEMGAGAAEAASETGDISAAAAGIDFDPAVAAAQALARALAAADAAASGISVPVGAGFASGTTNAPGGKTLVNELGPELISENGKAYIANGGRPAVVNLSKGAIVLPANVTKDALKGGIPTYAAAGGILGDPDYGGGAVGEAQRAREAAQRAAQQAQSGGGSSGGGGNGTVDPIDDSGDTNVPAAQRVETWTCPWCGTVNHGGTKCSKCGKPKPGSKPPRSGGGGRGGGGGSKKKSKKEKAQEAAEELEKRLTNIDKRAKLAHTEKKYTQERNLYNKAIALIKKQLSVYKKAGFKDKSNEVVDLKSKLHDYEDKIKGLNESEWDDIISQREAEIQQRRQQQEQQDREQALRDAQTALENAKKQRNVRIFNAATGQWEWVADQDAIDRAQEQYDSAQEAITRAREDAELEELRRQRESGEAPSLTSVVGTAIQATAHRAKKTTKNFIENMGATTGGVPNSANTSATKNGGSSDSHDTVYNFGNITLSEAEAQSTSVAELAKRLNVLKIS